MAQFGDRFGSSLNYDGDPDWARRVHHLGPEDNRHLPFRVELANMVRVVRALLSSTPVVLNSSAGRLKGELLAAAVAGLVPVHHRPTVVMVGEMWQRDPGLRGLLEGQIVRRADRVVDRYAVRSSAEMQLFPGLWDVSPEKLRFVPFFSTVDHLPEPPAPTTDAGYVFSGGEPFRDYDALLTAASALPERRFVLATSQLKGRPLPANVEAGRVSHEKFMALMAGAAVIVVPIQAGLNRAVGQQTYLNAMWLGKPVIVSDAPAVRDHMRDNETGLIVSGTPESYLQALRWLLDPANRDAIAAMTRAAAAEVRARFTFHLYVQGLLKVLDEAARART